MFKKASQLIHEHVILLCCFKKKLAVETLIYNVQFKGKKEQYIKYRNNLKKIYIIYKNVCFLLNKVSVRLPNNARRH